MKPFQIIVLVVFGLAALMGLFLFATFNGSTTGGGPVGPVTIWGSLPQSAVDAGIENLSRTNKEYNEVSYVEMSAEAIDSNLAEALASGYGPDLIVITQEQLLSQVAKLSLIPYTSISERTFRTTYTPIHEYFLATEGFYGMPIAVDPLVLYYNRTMLSAQGIPTPPTNWEAVTAMAERLTTRQPDQSIVKSAIAFGEYGNVQNARGILSLLLMQAGTTISEGNVERAVSTLGGTLESTGNAPAVSALNFYTQFANPVKTVYSWNRSLPSSRQAFLAGDLAFYVGYASEQETLSSSNPNLDFDMAPVPQPATTVAPKTYGLGYALAIPRASANFQGAFRTAVALTFAAPMEVTAAAAGMAPARRELLATTDDRFAEVYYPAALIASGWLSPAPQTTDSIFSAMIDNITTGRRDAASALISAHQSLTAALR
ncbi:extracellular solute-binding protein [Patescibacteria group bacterium]|nr:extracellular solute-binding protein [Patescibacteria group bacterium]